LVAYHDGTVIIGSARERIVGSIDRPVRPDQPDLPGRPDRPDRSERPKTPQDLDAKLAERLSTLTRASAYERLYARAQAQDAPFRERLASEESAQPKDSLSAGKPEHDLEHPRTYWTEVPRLLALWGSITEKWKGQWHLEPDPVNRSQQYDVRPERQARAADLVAGVPATEPPISESLKSAEKESNRRGWLVGFEHRLKGNDRLMEKVMDSLEAQPDATPEEAVDHIPDAIRYTFCYDHDDYASGYWDTKSRLESSGYEMYYAKNAWSDLEYKGVNTRWITPSGQRFEVQFHTRESFHAKDEVTHKAYERIRNPEAPRAEREDLRDFQRQVTSWIPVPPLAAEIPDYKKESF